MSLNDREFLLSLIGVLVNKLGGEVSISAFEVGEFLCSGDSVWACDVRLRKEYQILVLKSKEKRCHS